MKISPKKSLLISRLVRNVRQRRLRLLFTSAGLSTAVGMICSKYPWPERLSISAGVLTLFSAFTAGLAIALLIKHFRNGNSLDTANKRIPLRPLVRMIDWLPSKKLRQRIATLVADDQADLRKLRKDRRFGAARWREFCTWLIVVWYVVLAPLVGLKVLFVGAFSLLGHWASK